MLPVEALKVTVPLAATPLALVTKAVTVAGVPSFFSEPTSAATPTLPLEVTGGDPEQAQTSAADTRPRSLRSRFTVPPPSRRSRRDPPVIGGTQRGRQFSQMRPNGRQCIQSGGNGAELGVGAHSRSRRTCLERAAQPVARPVFGAGPEIRARRHHRGVRRLPDGKALAGEHRRRLVVPARELDARAQPQGGG